MVSQLFVFSKKYSLRLQLYILYRYTHGVSVVSDGWKNMKNKPLINVMASNSRGSMFLYAEDFSGEVKTGEAIAQFLLQAIEEIGPSNVLQVITDNASNCKVAGREIQRVCFFLVCCIDFSSYSYIYPIDFYCIHKLCFSFLFDRYISIYSGLHVWFIH
jgi:hypothetical protein